MFWRITSYLFPYGFSGIMKQFHNFKNPSLKEANQLAILQAWSRAGIRDYPEQIQLAVVWWDLNLGLWIKS